MCEIKLFFYFTKKSTIYGAAIDPTCAHIELVPNAELRISVGNISAVCNVTIAYTAVIPNLASIAIETIHVEFSIPSNASRHEPANANNAQIDGFLPIMRSKNIDSDMPKISTPPVAATYTTRFAAKLSAFSAETKLKQS